MSVIRRYIHMLSKEAIQQRVDEIIQQMTLEEKVAQMLQIP